MFTFQSYTMASQGAQAFVFSPAHTPVIHTTVYLTVGFESDPHCHDACWFLSSWGSRKWCEVESWVSGPEPTSRVPNVVQGKTVNHSSRGWKCAWEVTFSSEQTVPCQWASKAPNPCTQQWCGKFRGEERSLSFPLPSPLLSQDGLFPPLPPASPAAQGLGRAELDSIIITFA